MIILLPLSIGGGLVWWLYRLQRHDLRGVATIRAGLIVVFLSLFLYGATSYWFTYSMDIESPREELPQFEAWPWALGCSLIALTGVGLCARGFVERRATFPPPH